MIPEFVWNALKQLIPLTGLAAPLADLQALVQNSPPPVTVVTDNMTLNVTTTASEFAHVGLHTSTNETLWTIAQSFYTQTDGAYFSLNAGPSNSLWINNKGYVGFTAAPPQVMLDILRQAEPQAEPMAVFRQRTYYNDQLIDSLRITNLTPSPGAFIARMQGVVRRQYPALTFEGFVTADTGANPAIVCDSARLAGGQVTRPIAIFRNNSTDKVKVLANGDVIATSFNTVSSRSRKQRIVDLDSQVAADAVEQLQPVSFVYRDDAGRKRLGFIAEDVPAIVANPDRQSVPIMDTVALVTRVIKDQQQQLDRQSRSADEHQAQINQQASQVQQCSRLIQQSGQSLRDQQAENDKRTDSLNDLLNRLSVLEAKATK